MVIDPTLLIAEVGETDDLRLAANVSAVLAIWAGKDAVAPGLARLYAKRQLIDLAQGAVRDQVDFTAANDVGMKLGEKFAALQVMSAATLAEITRLETKSRGRRGGASQELITQTPQSPPWPVPPGHSANSRAIRGDPYRRSLPGRESGLP